MDPLHSAERFKHCRVGLNPSWGGSHCLPSGSCCLEGSGLPEQDGCCIWMLAQHWFLVAAFSVLSPKPPSLVSPQVSLVHSAPPLPVIYCLWLSPSVVYLVTRTQQSGLSTKGPGQRPSWVWGCCLSPHATAARRGVVCLSMKAAADWGMTQHQDPHGSSLSSLPKASIPSHS